MVLLALWAWKVLCIVSFPYSGNSVYLCTLMYMTVLELSLEISCRFSISYRHQIHRGDKCEPSVLIEI